MVGRFSWFRRLGTAIVVPLISMALLAVSVSPVAAATDSDRDSLTNAWEMQHGLNPNRRDTNVDGVRDPAEDRDNDRLSNRGEQRFGSDPNDPDTDNDGIDDGSEDANGNGVSNAKEQDRRPLPADLVPPLKAARQDRAPSYYDGCHSGPEEAAIHPCVYGDAGGSRTIAIFGDSHAQQWIPGLIRAANQRGWRIVAITKSACPSVHVPFQAIAFPDSGPACETWRMRGEAWLRSHPPDVLIVSNSRGYRVTDENGKRLRGSAWEERWKAGLAETLDNVPAPSAIVVLGDSPHLKDDPPRCLAGSGVRISDCQTARKVAWRTEHDDTEAAAAADAGARFVSLNDRICSYDPCPVVVNQLLMWRNNSHLTATYTAELAPAFAEIVEEALAP